MAPELDFLLTQIDAKYTSRYVAENGKTLKLTLKEKLLAQRLCSEDTFTRDEIYQFYVLLEDKHADKKADQIFFKANTNDTDNTID